MIHLEVPSIQCLDHLQACVKCHVIAMMTTSAHAWWVFFRATVNKKVFLLTLSRSRWLRFIITWGSCNLIVIDSSTFHSQWLWTALKKINVSWDGVVNRGRTDYKITTIRRKEKKYHFEKTEFYVWCYKLSNSALKKRKIFTRCYLSGKNLSLKKCRSKVSCAWVRNYWM